MTLRFKDYVNYSIEVEEGTTGGDTFHVNGKDVCFAYTGAHMRALRTLTREKSDRVEDVQFGTVDNLVRKRVVVVDESDCVDGMGYLGTKVWDAATEEYIGCIGDRCGKSPGWGTSHKGSGRCIHHSNWRKPYWMTDGLRNRKSIREYMLKKIQAYASMPDALDLTRELATQRAALELMVETMDGSGVDLNKMAEKVIRMSEYVGEMADRISKMQHRESFTMGQLMYVQVAVSEILRKYVTEPQTLEKAVGELSDRLSVGHALLGSHFATE